VAIRSAAACSHERPRVEVNGDNVTSRGGRAAFVPLPGARRWVRIRVLDRKGSARERA